MSLASSRSRSQPASNPLSPIEAKQWMPAMRASKLVMSLPLAWQEHEADEIAERIYDDRDLRRQAAARFADGLILSPPFAPVPC